MQPKSSKFHMMALNVMHKFQKDLKLESEATSALPSLLNLGFYGLHVGKSIYFFLSLHWLFHGSLGRRSDYTMITESTFSLFNFAEHIGLKMFQLLNDASLFGQTLQNTLMESKKYYSQMCFISYYWTSCEWLPHKNKAKRVHIYIAKLLQPFLKTPNRETNSFLSCKGTGLTDEVIMDSFYKKKTLFQWS